MSDLDGQEREALKRYTVEEVQAKAVKIGDRLALAMLPWGKVRKIGRATDGRLEVVMTNRNRLQCADDAWLLRRVDS